MSKAWEQVTPNVVNLGDLAGGLEDPQADVLGVDIRFYGIFMILYGDYIIGNQQTCGY